MGGAMTAALIGANMISGAGMLDFETCLSFEKLVIDAEIIGLSKRLVTGIEPRDNPIALDVMRQMGHRSDYLALPHTRKWFRKELYIPSEVIDRGSYDAWQQKGSKSVVERSAERVESLLLTYQPNSLSPTLRGELHDITLSAARRFGMEKLPEIESN
jgi:trimethylamine--corrinoid protein Co-methyltransferase